MELALLIGAMNHPMRDVAAEIRAFRDMKFDFVDLTLEPAKAAPETIDIVTVVDALAETGLSAVGHTAWYLPIGSAFDSLREAAMDEFTRCLDVFARLGIRRVNVHPDQRVPLHGRELVVAKNVETLIILAARSKERQIELMVENVPGVFNQVETLEAIFKAAPELRWHLDVGHANLGGAANSTRTLLTAFADRLVHVHFSDNRGGDADLHLPLGAGTINWRWAVEALKEFGYDGTITLEVFSADQTYLAMSRQKLRLLWDDVPTPTRG